MNDQPLISVLMPTYNQEDLLGDSIESVVCQTYKNWELIIGDDCSADKTFEVARSYQQKFPSKIKIFQNEKNLGITGNCNKILSYCSGDYISFTAGDDLFLPCKLEAQVRALSEFPNSVLVHHDVETFDSVTGQTLGHSNQGKKWVADLSGKSKKVAKKVVEYGGGITGQSVLLRRNAVPAHGYREGYINSDFIFWVECLLGVDGDVIYIDRAYCKYRRHKDNVTNNQDLMYKDQKRALELIENIYPDLNESAASCRAYYAYRDGVSLIQGGEGAEGRRLLLQHLKVRVYSWKWAVWWLISWFK